VIKHATTTQATISGEGLEYSSAVAHTYIQANTDESSRESYHFICWDSKLSTPGVQEWLQSIEPGNTIVVYPRYSHGKGNRVANRVANRVRKMEINIYWED
jgi:hypothetical protein